MGNFTYTLPVMLFRIVSYATFFITGALYSSPGADPVPRLVVVISFDQLRYDYLERFSDHFGEGGFNLFLKKGANFSNTHYRHSFTSTATGHAVVLSGSHGNANGIIANSWLDRETYEEVYCMADETAILIGTEEEGHGLSPRNFHAFTVGDQLKISTSGRSRVITMAHKNRSAILMGGKMADAAYWLRRGKYVTSDYYQKIMPQWVEDFNRLEMVKSYFGQKWERLLPEETYANQGADDFLGERNSMGMGRTMPKTIDGGEETPGDRFFHAFYYSPFSNAVLSEFAKAAVKNEQLGQREETDLLCIGYSANDAIGHQYGPDSHEVLDITVRADRLLEDLFQFLDREVGLSNCTLVLTADHGVSPLPEKILLANDRAPAGRVRGSDILEVAEQALNETFGPLAGNGSWLVGVWDNIYIRSNALQVKNLPPEKVEKIIKEAIEDLPFLQAAYTRSDLSKGQVTGRLGRQALLSFYPQRSGDVFYQLKPYYLKMEDGGTNHGSPYSYDTHVPLLWYGVGVNPGTYTRSTGVNDLAPTLSRILQVDAPPLSTGRILF